MIQSGDGDWIINSHPSGTDTGWFLWLQGRNKYAFWQDEGFYLAASHRQIKKTSPRPLRLCGEYSILDKNAV